MADENQPRTLVYYSRPIHEGYQNTIELPKGDNVVPLRSDTIQLVQNECLFQGLQSEDPNQHLKDFLKLVDSLELSFLPLGRTTKLRNAILIFQQHHGESLFEAWTRFKDLLQKVPHHGIDLWLQIQIFYDHVFFPLNREIDHATGGKLHDKSVEESWKIIEDLTLYDNEKPQQRILEPSFEARVQSYMAAHTKRMERFEDAIYKQREEINERMTEMFSLLKEYTKVKSPEKVLVREEVSKLVTKYVNVISLVRIENDKDKGCDEVIDKQIVEPINMSERKK
ncbi:zinc finger, CCHC-type containing protein [Tanacetum coccineum]